jgi:hypothetical protein
MFRAVPLIGDPGWSRKDSPMKKPKKKSRAGGKHQPPLSLSHMTFDQAIDGLLLSKPKPKKKPRRAK